MNFKKGMSLALTVALLGSGSLAYAESGKESDLRRAGRTGSGQRSVRREYFRRRRHRGLRRLFRRASPEYGGKITYEDGQVRFHSDAQRVYYQGNLNTRDLPWLFHLTYSLDGQPIEPEALAGQSGHVTIELEIQKNPDYTGELFRSHALQITAALDTEKCRNISAEGATLANVGTSRQLSYIVLPGTEKTIRIETDATEFEMDAISINGLRLSLDLDVDDSELTQETDKIVDAGVELDDGAQELLDGANELTEHNDELMDGAKQMVDAIFDAANAKLTESQAAFGALGVEIHPLTTENYGEEIDRLQSELLEKVDDYVLEQADAQLRVRVEEAAREQVETAVTEAARQQVTAQVTEAARGQVREKVLAGGEAQVRAAVEEAARGQVETAVTEAARQQVTAQVTETARQQVEAEIRNPSQETIDAQVEQQMQTPQVQAEIDAAVEAQLASEEVQAQIDAELTAQVRPQVSAAVEAQVRTQVEAAVRQQVRAQISAQVEAEIRAAILAELTQPTPAPSPSAEPTATPAPQQENGLTALIRSLSPLVVPAAYAEGMPTDEEIDALVREQDGFPRGAGAD